MPPVGGWLWRDRSKFKLVPPGGSTDILSSRTFYDSLVDVLTRSVRGRQVSEKVHVAVSFSLVMPFILKKNVTLLVSMFAFLANFRPF